MNNENKKEVTQAMRSKLRAPLPKEAVKPNPTKAHLSTIKPIFVTERLNDVFGIGAWQIRTEQVTPIVSEVKESAKGRKYNEFTALMKTILTIPDYGIYYECVAGSTNEDEGDSAKGGTTDGITKICSWMEIGINVFKGLGNVQTEPTLEDALHDYMKAESRDDATAVWNRYPQSRKEPQFEKAAKALSALYPKEMQTPVAEVKAPEQPKNEPQLEQPEAVELATEKQIQLIQNLANSHHIPASYRSTGTDLKSLSKADAKLMIDELTDMIAKGTELEKTTPATAEMVEDIEIKLENACFTEDEKNKGLEKLKKGYSIAQARNVLAKLDSHIQERTNLKVV